jgi:hypothetical protein
VKVPRLRQHGSCHFIGSSFFRSAREIWLIVGSFSPSRAKKNPQ